MDSIGRPVRREHCHTMQPAEGVGSARGIPPASSESDPPKSMASGPGYKGPRATSARGRPHGRQKSARKKKRLPKQRALRAAPPLRCSVNRTALVANQAPIRGPSCSHSRPRTMTTHGAIAKLCAKKERARTRAPRPPLRPLSIKEDGVDGGLATAHGRGQSEHSLSRWRWRATSITATT